MITKDFECLLGPQRQLAIILTNMISLSFSNSGAVDTARAIFEFKMDDGRVLCFFFVGQRVILTHGFSKKSQKTPKGEIERA